MRHAARELFCYFGPGSTSNILPWSIVRSHALIASVDGQWYALPAESIAEVVHMPALSTTAGCPPLVEGFLNLRGSLAPVVSLRRLFSLGDRSPELYSPLIVLRPSGEGPVALRVDSVDEVVVLPETPQQMRPLGPADSYNACARYAFTQGDRDVVLLAADLLFEAKERACLADLRRDAQRRMEGLSRPAAE